jgi:two-component system cell cycle sensor histidine kinase/response regulator CckA
MLPDASGKKQIDEALSASKMASELVDQLLSFSRKKEHAADVQPYDLNELICGMESLVKSSLGKRILLDTQLCDIPLSVRVDSTSVKQILLNLAVNARDAMPREGRFIIRTRFDAADTGYEFSDSKNWIVLEIADTGSGMDEETRKKAFEPFFTTKSPGKGTGMGLATVYAVVKQNQGTIDVKSAPGQGTRFIIRLPVAR